MSKTKCRDSSEFSASGGGPTVDAFTIRSTSRQMFGSFSQGSARTSEFEDLSQFFGQPLGFCRLFDSTRPASAH